MSEKILFEHYDPEITLRTIDMIKQRRLELSLSIPMLSSMAGITSDHLRKIEAFQRKEMSITTFFKLINALNIEFRLLKKETI